MIRFNIKAALGLTALSLALALGAYGNLDVQLEVPKVKPEAVNNANETKPSEPAPITYYLPEISGRWELMELHELKDGKLTLVYTPKKAEAERLMVTTMIWALVPTDIGAYEAELQMAGEQIAPDSEKYNLDMELSYEMGKVEMKQLRGSRLESFWVFSIPPGDKQLEKIEREKIGRDGKVQAKEVWRFLGKLNRA